MNRVAVVFLGWLFLNPWVGAARPFIRFEVTDSRSPKGRFLAAVGELDVLVASRAKNGQIKE